jgi:thiol-disulfide isomerase/thioredoxin
VARAARQGRRDRVWATWCGPCVEQIPQWNALVERYRGYPIQFIALSSEEAEDVEAFLQKRPMAGTVELDPDGSIFNAYRVDSVPRTVLVDGKGIIRGITTLPQLTDRDIQALLAGRNIGAPERQAAPG